MISPQAEFVRDIMRRDGGITHLVAQHYNIGCIRKEITRLRKAGYKVVRTSRRDIDGKLYSRWSLAH